MTETQVVHCMRDADIVAAARAEGRYVYIGRPGAGKPWRFGNPFSYKNESKAAVITDDPLTAYRKWLFGEAHTSLMQEERRWQLAHLHELQGKVLGCWCGPGRCHGDVLKELADNYDEIAPLVKEETESVATKKKSKIWGLTIRRPWPWLIVRPDVTNAVERYRLYEQGKMKGVENRTWKRDWAVGHYIAIHAGTGDDTADAAAFLRKRGISVTLPQKTVGGTIIGVAMLAAYVTSADELPEQQRRWFVGDIGWVLADVVPIEPVECRGAYGLWELPKGALRDVRRRYAEAIRD